MDAMLSSPKKSGLWRRLLKNEGGNFGIMTAILLPVTLATAGIAIDLTHMVQVRSELQNAADSAALAAATAMSDKGISKSEAQELARKFLVAQMANQVSNSGTVSLPAEALDEIAKAAVITAVETANGQTGKFFDVKIDATYNLAMNGLTNLIGVSTVPLSAASIARSATETKNALSMYLVLDKSGSMAWVTDTKNESKSSCKNYTERRWPEVAYNTPCMVSKMEALKAAVVSLTEQLKTADPESKYVRTGAVSYNLYNQSPSAFDWGVKKTAKYVDDLDAEGGTESAYAMQIAYNALMATTETTQHATKNGQVPSKYLLLMTDGDNNYSWSNTSTLATCTAAKAANIKVYTVAFMAPQGGRDLLKACASSENDYYDAKSAPELVAAFKAIGEKASTAMTRLTN